jgi:hypothetical protein
MKLLKIAFAGFCILTVITGCGTSGKYIIQSSPKGADIFVDDNLIGKTPVTINIPFEENFQKVLEKRIITLKLKGYKEFKSAIGYEGDKYKVLDFRLEPVTPQK